MENQTDYERAKAEVWAKFYKEELQGRPQWEPINTMQIFDYAFAEAFRHGRTVGMEDAKALVGNARYIEPPMPPIPKIAHVPEAAKKVDRAMIAAMAMQGLLSNSTIMVEISMAAKRSIETKAASPEAAEVSKLAIKTAASAAVRYADALINELNKTEQ